MRDSDVLVNNPHVSRSALEAMHGQVFGWALSRSDFEQVVAEDLVQQAYMELLTGKARFDGQSSLKTKSPLHNGNTLCWSPKRAVKF